MKIIFLDIDGVLNSEMYYRSVDRTIKDWSRFDPWVVDMVIELSEEFSASIVISSTWCLGAIKQLNNELTYNRAVISELKSLCIGIDDLTQSL